MRGALPRSAKRLLAICTLFAGASALSGTFLNIYFWKLLHGINMVAIYNFFIIFFTAVGYASAGWLAKRTDRLYTLRIGIGVLALFYVIILLLGPRVGPFYALLGCLLGLGNGFYWLSYNVLVFEVTEPETRDEFNGANGFLFAVASGAAPMLAGKILSTMHGFGYQILFLLSFSLFLAAVILTWRMKHREGPSFYNLYAGFRPEEHGSLWRRTLTLATFMGFREGTLSFLPFLLVFLVTKNELLAGRYLLLTSAGALVAYYFVKKYLSYERRPLFLSVAAVMLGLSVVWLLFQVNIWSLFTFGLLNALFSPLMMTPYACLTFDVMGQLPEAAHRKVEYLVIRELFVNTGRCLSILVLIASITVIPENSAVKIALFLIGLTPLVGLWAYRRASRLLDGLIRSAS